MQLTILGINSAKPVRDRHPSAQILNIHERLLLIDCGEGTQMQLLKYRIKAAKISHIFISHLHGDHYLGLIPLLDSFNLDNRTAPIYLYAPPNLQRVMQLHLEVSGAHFGFPVHFYPLRYDQPELIAELPSFTVKSIPLAHYRTPCTGFVFREKTPELHILPEKIAQYQIPNACIKGIKQGKDFVTSQGICIPNKELTKPGRQALAYAYCSDTAYTESILPHLTNIQLLYHEATYLDDCEYLAQQRGHSTAKQAASIAQKAGVQQLLIGHFSSRYGSLQGFADEAQSIFPQTFIAEEGKKYVIGQ